MDPSKNIPAWTDILLVAALAVSALLVFFIAWSLWCFVKTLKHRKKSIRYLFIATTTLAVVGTIAFSAWTYYVTRGVRSEIAKIRIAKEPLQLWDISNYTFEINSKEDNAYTNYRDAVLFVDMAHESDDFISDMQAFDNWARRRSDTRPTPEQQNRIQDVLKRNKDILDRVDRAAEFEDSWYAWQPQHGIGEMPFSRSMFVADTISLRCYQQLLDGDAEGAVQSAHALKQFARIYDADRLLIIYLIQIAVQHKFADDVVAILTRGRTVDDDPLRLLANDLLEIDRPDKFTSALMSERAYVIAAFGLVQQHPLWDIHSSEIAGFRMMTWPTKNYAAYGYLKDLRHWIEASRKPWPHLMDEFRKSSGMSLFGRMMADSVSRATVLAARTLANLRASRLAIFCELYRRKHGQLPETLDQLVPEFIEAVPLDPFDGQPMKYKRDGNEIVIYSVNDNRTDDGGVLTPPHEKAEAMDWGYRLKLGE